MKKQPRIPDTQTSKRLLANLRRTRLEIQEINLQLDEISAKLDEELREQKLQRIRKSLAILQS